MYHFRQYLNLHDKILGRNTKVKRPLLRKVPMAVGRYSWKLMERRSLLLLSQMVFCSSVESKTCK